MRFLKLTAACFTMALPFSSAAMAGEVARADDAAKAEQSLQQISEKLADPAVQNSVAGMAENLTAAMMRLPIGEFAAAIEDARPGSIKKDIPADATIADLAGDKAEYAPEIIGEQSRIAMGMMSGFAKVFAGLIPEFQSLADEMKTGLEAAQKK